MVQIVNLDPSEGNTRQRAFQQGLSTFMNAGSNAYESIRRAEAMKEMQRRQDEALARQEVQREEDLALRYGVAPNAQTAYESGMDAGRFQRLSDLAVAGQKVRAPSAYEKGLKERELQIKERDAETKRLALQQKAQQQGLAKTEKFSGEQSKAGGFAKRAEQAQSLLDNMDLGKFTGMSDIFSGSEYFPEYFKGEGRKSFEQAQNNFISAVLRKESGAAISDEEYKREGQKYFPQPGDTPLVLEQKRQARAQAIENLKSEAGGAYSRIATAPSSPVKKPSGEIDYVAGQVGNAISPNAHAAGSSPVMPGRPAANTMTKEQRDMEKQELLRALEGM